MHALAFAARPAADPGLVHLDVRAVVADAVPVGPHHAGAQLVQDAERGLVPGKAELPLELHRRQPGRVAGDKIGRPEPSAQWRVAPLHDGALHQAGLTAARAAGQDARPGHQAGGLADGTTVRARETVGPPDGLEVGGASRIVREQALEAR